MKNFLIIAVVLSASLVGPSLLAAQPPDLGRFTGVAFSSATDRHPLEIDGGSLVRCETDATSHSGLTKCEVEKGSVVVTGGTEWNNLQVKLARVVVLRTQGAAPTRHYYFGGTADLRIGGQLVAAPVKVTLTLEDAAPGRVRGFIDLPVQAARTSLEAYLVP
jgi:hypothetical protein